MTESYSGINDYDTYNDQEVVKIPSMTVINTGTTKVSVQEAREKRGWFFHSETGEMVPEINAVPLTLRKISSYSVGEYPKQSVVCRSSDFFYPSQSILTPICGSCRKVVQTPKGMRIVGVCPKAQWTSLDTGKKRQPECKESSVITFLNLKDETLFQLFFKGMSLYVGSPYMKFVYDVKKTGKDLYCFSVKLATVGGEEIYPDNAMADKARLVTFSDRAFLKDYEKYEQMAKELRSAFIPDEPQSSENGNGNGSDLGNGANMVMDDEDIPF